MSGGKGLYAKKFGQVLLKTASIAQREVDALELEAGNKILEIGPGQGVLTAIILEHDVKLTCVESDSRFVTYLSEKFHDQIKSGKLRIVKESILETEPARFDRIIGNIPYHISSDILFRLNRFDFDVAVLMVQKDFAERMVAAPGTENYSRLSVNCAYWYDVKLERTVKRGNFFPVPKVDSAIVSIRKRNTLPDVDPEKLDSVLVALFSNRRKKIGSVMKSCPEDLKDKRPEQIPLEDFIRITKSRSLS